MAESKATGQEVDAIGAESAHPGSKSGPDAEAAHGVEPAVLTPDAEPAPGAEPVRSGSAVFLGEKPSGGRARHSREGAFDEAVAGSRGWGLRAADIVFAAAVLLVAVAACLALWLGYGVQGVPGLTGGAVQEDAPATDESVPPDATWDATVPQIDGSAAGEGSDAATGEAGDAAGGVSGAAGGVGGATTTDAAGETGGAAMTDVAPSSVAVIQNTEGFYQVLPLDSDATVTVESDLGTNVVEVANGRVRCVESDCSNQVCVDTGWVSSVGQMVVCLPHRLTVQVVASAEDAAPLV